MLYRKVVTASLCSGDDEHTEPSSHESRSVLCSTAAIPKARTVDPWEPGLEIFPEFFHFCLCTTFVFIWVSGDFSYVSLMICILYYCIVEGSLRLRNLIAVALIAVNMTNEPLWKIATSPKSSKMKELKFTTGPFKSLYEYASPWITIGWEPLFYGILIMSYFILW